MNFLQLILLSLWSELRRFLLLLLFLLFLLLLLLCMKLFTELEAPTVTMQLKWKAVWSVTVRLKLRCFWVSLWGEKTALTVNQETTRFTRSCCNTEHQETSSRVTDTEDTKSYWRRTEAQQTGQCLNSTESSSASSSESTWTKDMKQMPSDLLSNKNAVQPFIQCWSHTSSRSTVCFCLNFCPH